MLLYVATISKVVCAVLVVEHQTKKSTKHHLVYFVSEVLHGAHSRYANIQKIIVCCTNVLSQA